MKALPGFHPAGRLWRSRFAPGETVKPPIATIFIHHAIQHSVYLQLLYCRFFLLYSIAGFGILPQR
jgi:hypothetical protein